MTTDRAPNLEAIRAAIEFLDGYDVHMLWVDVAYGALIRLVEGAPIQWCETHRVEQKILYLDDYDGPQECQDAPYFGGDCSIVTRWLSEPPPSQH